MDDFIIKLGSIGKNKTSHFFKIKDAFFEDFIFSEIKNVDIEANVILFKDLNKINLRLILDGKINDIACDICNEKLAININCSTKLIIKKSQRNLISTDEIIYLQKNENSINLKQIIFELIVLNIPAKREHPLDKNGNRTCDKGMVELLNKYMPGKSKLSDPRWDALKNIK